MNGVDSLVSGRRPGIWTGGGKIRSKRGDKIQGTGYVANLVSAAPLDKKCDPRQPLKPRADPLLWNTAAAALAETYSEKGRPAKPILLMVGLLLLNQLEDLSDDAVVAGGRRTLLPAFLRDAPVSRVLRCDLPARLPSLFSFLHSPSRC